MTPTLRVLIVDDEAPARKRLRTLLQRQGGCELVGEAADGAAAVASLSAGGVDVVLLDIQMPEMDGFDVVEAVGAERMPAVIFVTAFDEHALRAFRVHAVDYLLKPASEKDLADALDRVRALLPDAAGRTERIISVLSELKGRDDHLLRLIVPERDRLVVVPVPTIQYLKAAGNYVEVHAGSRPHLWRGTLTSLESRLDPRRFVRIHRSTVVNLDAVRQLEPWGHGDHDVIMRDGTRLRLSRRYRDRLLDPDGSG